MAPRSSGVIPSSDFGAAQPMAQPRNNHPIVRMPRPFSKSETTVCADEVRAFLQQIRALRRGCPTENHTVPCDAAAKLGSQVPSPFGRAAAGGIMLQNDGTLLSAIVPPRRVEHDSAH